MGIKLCSSDVIPNNFQAIGYSLVDCIVFLDCSIKINVHPFDHYMTISLHSWFN